MKAFKLFIVMLLFATTAIAQVEDSKGLVSAIYTQASAQQTGHVSLEHQGLWHYWITGGKLFFRDAERTHDLGKVKLLRTATTKDSKNFYYKADDVFVIFQVYGNGETKLSINYGSKTIRFWNLLD